MVETQKHLLTLMEEFQNICRQKNIPFALCGRSAAMASQTGSFVSQCYEMHFMVPAPYLPKLKTLLLKERKRKLRQAIKEKDGWIHSVIDKIPLDRGVETREENPDLPLDVLRYVDLTTTLIDRDEYAAYNMPGAAITLHPLYTRQPSEEEDLNERGLFYYNGGKPFNYLTMNPENKEAVDHMLATLKNTNVPQVAADLAKSLKKQPEFKADQPVWLRKHDGLLLELDPSVVTNVKMIPSEDKPFPIPAGLDDYLLLQYGKKWKEKAFEPLQSSHNVNMIIDGFTPFQQYVDYMKEYGTDIIGLKKKLQRFYFWKSMEFKPIERTVNTEYLSSKRSADRIDLFTHYKPLIPQMEKLLQEKNMEELGKMMDAYLEATDRYYKKGLGFYINEPLFRLADEVMKARKKKTYMDKVRALVPEQYLREDVDDFLKEHGYDIQG